MTFRQLCDLCCFFGLIEENLYSKLREVNTERNKWVHGYIIKPDLNKLKAKRLALKSKTYVAQIVNSVGKIIIKK